MPSRKVNVKRGPRRLEGDLDAMQNNEKTIYLIDGSNYIHRAYHAIRQLATSEGFPTNAIYGFTTMVLSLLDQHQPEYVAVALDTKGPTFRHKLYEAYKANRPPTPEDLLIQTPYIKQVLEALRIPALERPGYEADDLMGTVAKMAEKQNFHVVLVTGDKDFKQLLSSNISIWDPMKDHTISYDSFKTHVGLEPSQWVDVMGLWGDSSDNIPGVPMIGEKTAIQLIKTFGSMVSLFTDLEKVPREKLRKTLTDHREQAFLSRQLVLIDSQAPISIDLGSLKSVPPDAVALGRLFRDLEFRSLQERFPLETDLSHKEYTTVTDEKTLDALLKDLEQSSLFALDLETTSTNPMAARIVGISFSCRPDQATYIPLGHKTTGAEKQLGLEPTLRRLKPILEDAESAKGGQNIKYDWILLRRAGIDLSGVVFDTMVESYLIDPAKRTHNLSQIAAEHLDHKMISYKEVTHNGTISFPDVAIGDATTYACEDADVSLTAHQLLSKELEERGLKKLYEKMEVPLIPVLVDMQLTGVRIDRQQLKKTSEDFRQVLSEIQAKIYASAGEEFNIQSHQQLGQILFKKLNLPVQKKTKLTKGYSTDVEVLKALATEHELPNLVLQYRSLSKLKSTYTDALMELIHPETGRIHTSYNQTVTATGRLSSSEPNLQNIPIRTDEGKKVRSAFIPKEDWLMFSADYSQIELRLLAHYSEDEILLEAFANDEDIHTRTATEIFQLFPSMITAEMRRQAKVINFGIIYGMGPFRLSKELGISQKMAKTYIEHYFQRYQGVKRFIEDTIRQARHTGYTKTLLDRCRWLPQISSTNRTAREFAERTAVNTPLQGTAADLIKLAMIDIFNDLKSAGFEAKMLLQVHDELVFECPADELEAATDLVKSIMEGIYLLRVPLKVNINWGRNWTEAH